jgi:hypothetical protein
MGAEVSVELKLVLEGAKRQAAEFAKAANRILSTSIGGDMGAVAAGTNKAAAAQENLARKTKQTTSELAKQIAEWRKLNPGGIAPGQKITFADQPGKSSTRFSRWYPGQTVPMTGSGLATNPAEILAKQSSDALLGNLKKNLGYGMADLKARGQMAPHLPSAQFPTLPHAPKEPAPASGMMGVISSMRDVTLPIGQLLASFYVIIRAISAALVPLKMFAKMVMQAAEAARKLYANALMSGMGIGMTVKRNMLANILGVSENDIFQFGRQIAALNDQLETAYRITAKTNASMATTGIEFKVLEANMAALKAEMADKVSPETVGFTMILSKLTAATTSAIDKITTAHPKLVEIGKRSILQTLFGFVPGSAFDDIRQGAKAIGQNQIDKVGSPQAYMKQMPASAWERMGLQVGGTGGTNYAAKTADSTAKSATYLQRLLEAAHKAGRMTITRGMALPSAP